jgi:hypothetical protein
MKRYLSGFLAVSILLALPFSRFAFGESWEKVTETQRKKLNDQYDKKALYKKNGMESDTSERFLQIPAGVAPAWMEGVEIAKTPPTIEFAPVRGIDPMYFPEDNKSLWSNWADVTFAPNGRFYYTEGDHRGPDSHIYLWEYDPIVHDSKRVVDFAHLCGWDKLGVGDSKIHGDMGVMADGVMWILTYWDPDPKPSPENYAKWPGSHLVRYDTYSGRAQDMGIPMPKSGWPYYTLDPVRGILFSVGSKGEILCYHVLEKQASYAGYPPEEIHWGLRCTMLDPVTGYFWCATQNPPYNFVSFDPRTNTFTKYAETTPPDMGKNKGNSSLMRAHSHKRSPGGFFWVNSQNGTLYKFWPDTRKTETVTLLWADETYAPRIEMSEDCSYIYYMPNLVQSHSYHQPVMQFNTRTGKRKVIAFTDDYYFEKYGFFNGGAHGLALSADGSTLMFNLNGAFKPRVEPFYGNPAIMVVHIPESERK